MFGIKPNDGVDINLFNEKYYENKDILEDLIADDKSEIELEKKVSKYDYDEISRLFEFLQMCETNYTVVNLIMPIMFCLHQREDEMFLDLYMAQQKGMVEDYLNDKSLSELGVIRGFLENDNNRSFVFPDMYLKIIEKEKSYHI